MRQDTAIRSYVQTILHIASRLNPLEGCPAIYEFISALLTSAAPNHNHRPFAMPPRRFGQSIIYRNPHTADSLFFPTLPSANQQAETFELNNKKIIKDIVALLSIEIEDIKAEYICPISYEILSQPTVTACGSLYNRENILSWLDKNEIDPIKKIKLAHKNICLDERTQLQIKHALQAELIQAIVENRITITDAEKQKLCPDEKNLGSVAEIFTPEYRSKHTMKLA